MQDNSLRQSLKQRHITMIALGGVIGAGLFVGSGAIIATAGPAAILSYLIGGVIVTLVMFMLGEMASRNPDSGSFSTYASSYLGEWAGFAVGWLYWFVDDDDHRRGDPARRDPPRFPAVAARVGGALFMLVTLIASNAYSVRSFGEAEYWLSFAKVTTIIIFMALGASILLGFQPRIPAAVNLTDHGGFMPNGISPVLAGVMVVIFSLGGSEIAAVAAGESENPSKNVIRAIKSVIVRVMVFYVGSVSILIQHAVDRQGQPEIAVRVAVQHGRLHGRGRRDEDRAVRVVHVGDELVPVLELAHAVLAQPARPRARDVRPDQRERRADERARAVSRDLRVDPRRSLRERRRPVPDACEEQRRVRDDRVDLHHRRALRDAPAGQHAPRDPQAFRAWFYPVSNWIALLALVAVLGSQAFNPDSRFQFWFTVLTALAIVAAYFLRRKPAQLDETAGAKAR